MKQIIAVITILLLLPFTVIAQHEDDMENGIVSLAGKEGFTIGTKKAISYSSPTFWYKRPPTSIITMMKD